MASRVIFGVALLIGLTGAALWAYTQPPIGPLAVTPAPATTPPAEVTPTPIPTATPTASPAPTPTPARLLPTYGSYLDRVAEDVLGLLLAITKLLAIPLVLLLLLRFVAIIWRTQDHRLILADLTDGTGEEILARAMPGLTQLAKGYLNATLTALESRATRDRPREPKPKIGRRNELGTLAEAVSSVAPGAANAVITLIRQLLPPADSEISARVLSLGDRAHDVGIAVAVAPLRGDSSSTTLWEVAQPYPAADKRRRADRMVRIGMTWAAVELWKSASLARCGAKDDTCRALAHNFAGRGFALATGVDHALYGHAERELEEANRCAPNWFAPRENLGDLLSLRGINEQRKDLQTAAITEYREALRLLKAFGSTVIAGRDPSPQVQELSLQIRIAEKICESLGGETAVAPEVDKLIQDVRVDSNKNVELLYTIACWYATQWRASPDRATLEKIGRYLAAAAIRGRAEIQDWPLNDPDLEILGEVRLGPLLKQADRAIAENKELPSVESIANVLESVLERAGWKNLSP